jgi:hypothetical protein
LRKLVLRRRLPARPTSTAPATVRREVAAFFDELPRRVTILDTALAAAGAASAADADDLLYERTLEVIAWTHGEWIRIHPFADNNGCTARLLTIFIAAHFGLPLPLQGKPRRDAPVVTDSAGLDLTYDRAAAAQMVGTDLAMVEFSTRSSTHSCTSRPVADQVERRVWTSIDELAIPARS